jgi:site-specific DNA-methyltransferase (adenine-specific)
MDRNLLLRGQGHTPDILECLANLSSDEVFTPPEIANQMLDLLPAEVWGSPDLKWLDPACKTGVFLREAAKRLMVGLKDAIPDEVERRDHIFKNMLHGFAITELTALVSRRTLYYSKDAHGDHAIIHFDNPNGNILFERREHTWKGKDGNRRCEQCGAPESIERDGMENHAYRFIHLDEKEKQMKFDVIIGNPPYQMSSNGGTRDVPIYHLFVESAKSLKPKFISMIIPSRWMAGGLGLSDFREDMLNDTRISHLVDFFDASKVFPGVQIRGGVCYFLWDRDINKKCLVTYNEEDEIVGPTERDLGQFDIFVRDARAISILQKVLKFEEAPLSDIMAADKEFGMTSNYSGYTRTKMANCIPLYRIEKMKREQVWMRRVDVKKSVDLVERWKVLLPKASVSGDPKPRQVLGKAILAPPPSVCTQSYLFLYLNSELEAKNAANYLETRFARFLISLRKITQDTTKSAYKWTPQQDWNSRWTDDDLYAKYGITENEKKYIESLVKDWN